MMYSPKWNNVNCAVIVYLKNSCMLHGRNLGMVSVLQSDMTLEWRWFDYLHALPLFVV